MAFSFNWAIKIKVELIEWNPKIINMNEEAKSEDSCMFAWEKDQPEEERAFGGEKITYKNLYFYIWMYIDLIYY